MPTPTESEIRPARQLSCLLRFRVSPLAKSRFEEVAGEFGLTPSLLLRKFVFAVARQPGIAERLMALRHPGIPVDREG